MFLNDLLIPLRKDCNYITKTNQLMLFWEVITALF
jgi:hypothetical protein